jgi:hypothetical protein
VLHQTKSKKDLSTEALKKKTVDELKDLLKLEGLPLSGNRSLLSWSCFESAVTYKVAPVFRFDNAKVGY